jgi:uncharacterized protein involved in outer membrane biogenesis
MKKAILIAVPALAVLLAALIAVPFIFRDALLQKTKTTINRNLPVNVDFEGFRLSLLSNFPKASISLKNIRVTGKGAFSGDTLLSVRSASTKFGIFDLLSPGNITIQELILDGPELKLLVNSNEQANWNMVPGSEEAGSIKDRENTDDPFGLQLDKISVQNGRVTYTDETMPLSLVFNDLNLLVKGKMYGSETRLMIEGSSGETGLTYDSVAYLSKTLIELKSNLDILLDTWNFAFSKGELLINRLPMKLDGSFSMPGDSVLFDLSFGSDISRLDAFLQFIPEAYQSLLKDVNTAGNVSLTGNFKGLYYEETYPALNLTFTVSEGNLQYSGLPEEIRNIAARIALVKPQGSFDLTKLLISDAHAEIRNNPVDFSLTLENLLEDIRFDGNLAGKMNFDQIREAIPMDSMMLSGLVDVNIGVSGSMSAINDRRYELLKTNGIVALNDFSFQTTDLAVPVQINAGRMDFSPEKVNLQQLDMKIGASDMSVSGFVSDYYPYLFSDGTLTGNVVLRSGYMNLNELMAIRKGTEETKGSNQSKTDKKGKNMAATDTALQTPAAFTVPERISIVFNTDIKRGYFDRIAVSNIRGQVTAGNGKLDLSGLTMNLLNGELKMAGFYEKQSDRPPRMDLSLDMARMDIPAAFQSLKLVRNYLPVSAQSKGQFSTTLNMSGGMDDQLNFDFKTLNGTGLFSTNNVRILNSPLFTKLKTVLKEEIIRDVRIDDFTASFTIENGDLLLRPFTTKISGQEATFTGRLSHDNLIDMNIRFMIRRDALSDNIRNTIGIIPGQKNLEIIPVAVNVKGIVKDPDVKIDLSEARGMIMDGVKNSSSEDIRKTINKVGEGLKKLFK